MDNPLITSDLDLAAPEPEGEFDEKQEVTDINPDEEADTKEPRIRADDHEAMMKKYMEELPDLDTAEETVAEWHIKDWANLSKKEHGPIFQCAENPWRVLFFPYGNNTDWASFYLEHGFEDKPSENWYCCVQFLLVLSNVNDPSIYVTHHATHRFTSEESDWGFTRFAELRKLHQGKWDDSGRPLVEDGEAIMTAYVRVVKDPTGVLWHNFVNYDSKKETGMVGLKNQGATCYLNSLLQSLFFTNAFRKAVYQIPTEEETSVRDNSAYALQRLFYMLQKDQLAVPTNELTMAFGWESRQIFEQQDVQELSRILMDKLENRMKGSAAEKALPTMFVGQMKTYIDCINVNYESSRLEDFWDIQLNVRGNNTLDDSFKDYIQTETLEGDNKYQAEGHGLQDAKKGVIFESFPEVLHLQLKRFEYNFQADAMTKVYDRCEFPEVWDASPYLSENADKSEPYIYHLHGVLVHSGDLNAGHYYAFLKPTKKGDFYKFDDDRVTKATKKEAMEENFGGDFASLANGTAGQRNPYTRTWSKQRYMSAYMLVYIRESRLDRVLHEITDDDIPPHLEEKIIEERNDIERKRKEREEAHLYITISVGTNAQFRAHQGFDLFPTGQAAVAEAEPEAVPKIYRILRKTTMLDFGKMIATDFGLEEDLIRPWALVGRQNGTVRPDVPMTWPELTIEETLLKIGAKPPIRVWIEPTTRSSEGLPEWVDVSVSKIQKDAKPIVLFLKYFDAQAQTLKGQNHVIISNQKKISELVPLILQQMGWNEGVNLKLYEEIRQGMIEAMDTRNTFTKAELQDGDIVCFQKVLSESEAAAITQAGKFADPKAFYDYLQHKIKIVFSNRLEPYSEEGKFTLVLSRKMTYDQVAAKVAEHLQTDPTHLRFCTVNASTGRPKSTVKTNMKLENILNPASYGFSQTMSSARGDWLLYEVLEMSLSELETKKPLKITLLSEGITKETVIDVYAPKSGSIADIIPSLQRKAKLSDEEVDNLRFYETQVGRINHELDMNSSVAPFNEWVTIYAEQLPEEEKDASEDDRAVYAFHFDKEPSKWHAVPFKFIVKPSEVFKDTKERLSKRTGLKGKQLEKIKFAIVGKGVGVKPEYLNDDDILFDKLDTGNEMLGLDHINKARSAWNKSDVMMIR